MYLKDFVYKDNDGIHFPDARTGSENFYELDVKEYLIYEDEDLVRAEWTAEKGIEIIHDEIHKKEGIVAIKVKTPIVGSYSLVCRLITADHGVEQTTVIPMVIKVYE